jgi:hypothetical protein
MKQLADALPIDSPEDQALLEAEYLRNPKPDKAARMAIVSQVALGEKEVQVRFQRLPQDIRLPPTFESC